MARTKGAKGVRTYDAAALASKMGVDPLEFMLKMVKGDYKYFGFDSPTKITYTMQGIEVEEPNLKMSDRVQCADKASRYLYPQKTSVAVTDGEGKALKLIVEDYTKKE